MAEVTAGNDIYAESLQLASARTVVSSNGLAKRSGMDQQMLCSCIDTARNAMYISIRKDVILLLNCINIQASRATINLVKIRNADHQFHPRQFRFRRCFSDSSWSAISSLCQIFIETRSNMRMNRCLSRRATNLQEAKMHSLLPRQNVRPSHLSP